MIESIFPGITSTRKRSEINSMLRRLYGSSMTVEDALHNHNINLHGARERERLAYLVLSVRNGKSEPEYLDIEPGRSISLWSVKSPFAWTCARIKDQAGWDKAVAYFCNAWDVDTAWGTFRDGMSAFDGEDIYLFRKYIDRFTIDDPESNWDGCESSHTFLTVSRLKLEEETYMEYLQAIRDGESDTWTAYVD